MFPCSDIDGLATGTSLWRRSNVVSLLHERHSNLTVFSATATIRSTLAPQCSQAKSIDTLNIVDHSPQMAAVSACVASLSGALRRGRYGNRPERTTRTQAPIPTG